MGTRAVRRATRELDGDESLLASVVGYDTEARRRVVVVASDRRLLLSPLRPGPSVEIAYERLDHIRADGPESIEIVSADGNRRIERITDRSALRTLVDLADGRTGEKAAYHRPAPPKVRIIRR